MHRYELCAFAIVFALVACTGDKGADGTDGIDGTSCTVTDNGDGTKTVSCDDGTSITVSDGTDGAACTVTDNGDGTKTISCDDGTSVTVGDGISPLAPGETPGLDVTIDLSDPANGTHYVDGEQIVITMTALTDAGKPVFLDDLATAGLYINGPRDVTKTKTAVGLLKASSNYDDPTHFYIDLKTTTNTNLAVTNNIYVYTTEAVNGEDPGTYTVGFRGTMDGFPLDQVFALADFQLNTATVEPLEVGGCGDCHKGAANNVMYMHHVDPGYSPLGSPALDSVPVRTCKMCHNEAGYASIRKCDDGSYPERISGVYTCEDGTQNYTRVPDPIVRRVHGLHNGMNLLTAYNQADFENYLELDFPADIKNCTKCHQDDSYKTKPSPEACGACHDNVDFSTGELNPPKPSSVACSGNTDCAGVFNGFSGTCNLTSNTCELASHTGGTQTTCSDCHGAGSIANIDEFHLDKVNTFAPNYTVTITMSAPTNGSYYVDESPVVTIAAEDGSGNPLDPNTVDSTWNRARLFVYGPTGESHPVLTAPAANPDPTSHYTYVDMRDVTADANANIVGTTWTYDLSSVAGLEPGTYFALFMIRQASGSTSSNYISFQVGTATAEKVIATNCSDCHATERMHGSYPFDPNFCKACHDYNIPDPAGVYDGWGDTNYGFGAAPINRRVHRVHFGKYLNTTVPHDFSDIVFPQDVRNCNKCHSEVDTYKKEPTRLSCFSCHDSDAAVAHGTIMTIDPTPAQPWSGDEVESCETCHGPGRDFSIEKSHNISDPYVPPYPR